MVRLKADNFDREPKREDIDVHPRDIAGHDRQPRIEPGEPLEIDRVELASIESFPCSDPPGYGTSHA